MAEFILKDMVKKRNLEKEFLIKSSATSYEEIGNDVHKGTIRKLNSVGILVEKREAIRRVGSGFQGSERIVRFGNHAV